MNKCPNCEQEQLEMIGHMDGEDLYMCRQCQLPHRGELAQEEPTFDVYSYTYGGVPLEYIESKSSDRTSKYVGTNTQTQQAIDNEEYV